MPRKSGAIELDPVKRGILLDATLFSHVLNRQAAKRIGVDEGTVQNVKKRAEEAEKENLDPFHQRSSTTSSAQRTPTNHK